MSEAVLDWAAVVLPTVLAIVGVFVSLETPQLETKRERVIWRLGLVAFGIVVSTVTWFQQSHARRDAAEVKGLLGTSGISRTMHWREAPTPANRGGTYSRPSSSPNVQMGGE